MKYQLVLASSLLYIFSVVANGQSISERADSVVKSNALTPKFAATSSNRDIMERIRKNAKAGNVKSSIALLRVADPEIVAFYLAKVRARHWADSVDATKCIGLSGQPSIIALLAPDLLTDEPAQAEMMVSGDEHFRIPRVSILATEAIQMLIGTSPEFPAEVKNWSKGLQSLKDHDRELARASLRGWWIQNQTSLLSGQYANTRPPE